MSFDRATIEAVAPTDARALGCLAAFYEELGRRFPGGFDVLLSADPASADMEPPRGTFLIALADEVPVGCVGLKGTDKGYAEVKRLWTAPAARGVGLAKRLMDEVEVRALALGVRVLRLDCHHALGEAVAFYRKRGWQEIGRFNDDPYPDLFFEKTLRSSP